MPSNPADAKGLLKSAVRDDNPVVFIEHRGLYWSKGGVPDGEFLLPLGAAHVVRRGNHLTIIALGNMVGPALAAADQLAREGITAEVIDPPTEGDRITFGSTVLLEDEAGKEHRYWIVGSDEAEPARGRISVLAPLARTLIGKSVGDRVTAQLPGGKKTFDVLKANFPWAE